MNSRFSAAILVFAIACMLQFSFVPTSAVNFIFATLIAFAFVFSGRYGLWELLVFVLAGVFIINWQPSMSITLAMFAAIPCAAYFFRFLFPWEAWIGVSISLFSGFLMFYFVAVPRFLLVAPSSFFLNLFVGSAFGLFVFFSMDRVFGTNHAS